MTPAAPTASPPIVERFEAWRVSMLACHFAEPCPDEVMDELCDREVERMRELLAVPATCAGDLLLKLFPLAMNEVTGRVNGQPFALAVERRPGTHYIEDDVWEALVRDLPVFSVEIAAAMASPSRQAFVS